MQEHHHTDHPIDAFFRRHLKQLQVQPHPVVYESVMNKLRLLFSSRRRKRASVHHLFLLAGLIAGFIAGWVVHLLYTQRAPQQVKSPTGYAGSSYTQKGPTLHPPGNNTTQELEHNQNPLPVTHPHTRQGAFYPPAFSSHMPSQTNRQGRQDLSRQPPEQHTTASERTMQYLPLSGALIPIEAEKQLPIKQVDGALWFSAPSEKKHPPTRIAFMAGATLVNTWLLNPNPYERYSYKPYSNRPTLSVAPSVGLTVFAHNNILMEGQVGALKAGQRQKIEWGGELISRQIKINYITGVLSAGKRFYKMSKYGPIAIDLLAGIFMARMYRAGDYENFSLRQDIYNRLKTYDWGIHLTSQYSITLTKHWFISLKAQAMLGLRDINAPAWQTGKGGGMHNLWIGTGISCGYVFDRYARATHGTTPRN